MTARLPPPLRPSSATPPPRRHAHAAREQHLHLLRRARAHPRRHPPRTRPPALNHRRLRLLPRLRPPPPPQPRALPSSPSFSRPHVFLFNSILRSLQPGPDCSPLPLFRRFLCLGVRPNRYTFPLLLTCLSSLRDLRAVHPQVAKSGFSRDIHVRNALLARYAACDPDLAHAEQLFDEMTHPDVVAWTTMITSYKNRGRTFQALATFRRILAASVAPNRVTMVAALGACAAHGAGTWIHEYVQKQGWELDVVLGTALVDMMEADGVRPDAVTLVCVLCACAHAGFVDIGRKIFHLIVQGEYGFQPGIKHYGCMVDLLSRSGHLDDAFSVVETMPSQPNAVIWGLLLRGCKAHGDSQLSEHVMRRLVELEPENASHYVLLSNLYAETGRWQEAEEILQWMKKNGLRKDAGWSLRMLGDRLLSPKFDSPKLMLPIQGSFVR
ncbi:hypothetical protein ACQ4PT_005218 [Festuca glaucescens]